MSADDKSATAAAGPALSEWLGAGGEARCWCRACNPRRLEFRFVVCPMCGDKRCIHAHNHAAPCAKVSLYEHNAWVERMALRTDPASGQGMPQLAAVIALGAWNAPNVGVEPVTPATEE